MKNLTLENIAKACHGTYHGESAYLSREISDVTIDSRKVTEGALFIAICGERSDGHDYISDIYEKGGLCCISQKELPEETHPYIQVDSSLEALKELAEFYRRSLDIKVIGITGSVGKTSTKEMIASVLEQNFRVLKTSGNHNNAIGLPLTIFRLREEHQIAVLEMGISEFGEMRVLSKIARPDIVVMTNIGQCHLEFLGSRDGILKAKSEIFEYMNRDGMIFLNGDDDKLAKLREINGITPHFFGLSHSCEAYAEQIHDLGLSGITCTLQVNGSRISTHIPLPGRHTVYNALAGALIGKSLGLTDDQIDRGIRALKPVIGRENVLRLSNLTVIDDCYNANPVSMKGAIDILSSAKGRKVCVLGDMFELGAEEKRLHYETGAYLAEKDVDLLLTAGTLAKVLAKGAADQGFTSIHSFDTTEELAKKIPAFLQAGDVVLVKASHGMNFQTIVTVLTAAAI